MMAKYVIMSAPEAFQVGDIVEVDTIWDTAICRYEGDGLFRILRWRTFKSRWRTRMSRYRAQLGPALAAVGRELQRVLDRWHPGP